MTVTLQRLGGVCDPTAKCSQKRLNFFSMMISSRGLRGKDEGVKAGLVDEGNFLLSTRGDHFVTPFILRVNMEDKTTAPIQCGGTITSYIKER